MAYATGVSTTLNDLLTAVFNFAVANSGFTVGPSWSYTLGGVTYDVRSLVKNGINYNFGIPRTGEIWLGMNTTPGPVVTSAAQVAQPLACASNAAVRNSGGPHVGYHLFGDSYCVCVAVEIVTNVFIHFSFGEIVKNGTWDGGQYVMGHAAGGAQYWNTILSAQHVFPFINHGDIGVGGNPQAAVGVNHMRTSTNGPIAGLHYTPGSTVNSYAATTASAGNCGLPLLTASPNTFNGRSPLVPVHVVQGSSGGVNGPYYQMGSCSIARLVNIRDLNPKEIVNSDWMVFPVSQKNGPNTTYISSGNYGIAYKQ